MAGAAGEAAGVPWISAGATVFAARSRRSTTLSRRLRLALVFAAIAWEAGDPDRSNPAPRTHPRPVPTVKFSPDRDSARSPLVEALPGAPLTPDGVHFGACRYHWVWSAQGKPSMGP